MDSPSGRERLARWLLAVGCFALLLFFFSPSWAAFSLWARVPEMGGMLEMRRGASVLQQVAHPGAAIADPLHAAIQWRLLFPLLGHVLHLPVPVFFGLAHVGCIAVFAFVIGLLRRAGASWSTAALATVLVGSAGWFFASTGWLGYFDSWVVLALLLVAFGRTSWTAWAACVWAPWVDERLVVGLPLALVCRARLMQERESRAWIRDAVVAGTLALAFVAVRLGVLAGHTQTGATVPGYFEAIATGNAPWPRVLLGLWDGLRGGWMFVAATVIGLWRSDRAWSLVLASVTAVVAAVAMNTAQDFGRSLMFLAPVVVLGALRLMSAPPVWLRKALVVSTACTLLLPAHHVMSDRVNPIYYLYHELAAFQNPPAAAMPEMFELRAIRAMQDGNFASAEADLTLAIKLASDPAPAAKQRGVLRASHGRWKDAGEDFALMARHEPKNPDAWFMRAQASLAVGDRAAAEKHFAHATELGGSDWSTRPDVARFRAKLAR